MLDHLRILAIGIGDEEGFAPPITQPHEALDLLVTAVEKYGYTGLVKFGIDPASSEFSKSNSDDLAFKDTSGKSLNPTLSPAELGHLYQELIKDYPIVLLEDPFRPGQLGCLDKV